jgi:NADH-quinone oxidoreductase subunit F
LVSGIPAYRLPRDVLEQEIAAIIHGRVTLECGLALGRDFTLDDLFSEGYEAVFLAMGAHQSRRLGIEGETADGVMAGLDFLKAHNLRGESLARGRVAVIGGGNSAVDAARVALRQDGVTGVSILYRRTREEMPAFAEDIEAALDEGIELRTLVSPLRILTEEGRLSGVECLSNTLGEHDTSGRRRPVPKPGTEHVIDVDTLLVAISEQPDTEVLSEVGLEVKQRTTLHVDPETMVTSRPGVFSGGDVVTGPSTVINAIAAGKRAAVTIDRYLNGLDLVSPRSVALPEVYVEPVANPEDGEEPVGRADQPTLPMESRVCGFAEVDGTLSEAQAIREASRCLRCDLEFTQPLEREDPALIEGGKSA